MRGGGRETIIHKMRKGVGSGESYSCRKMCASTIPQTWCFFFLRVYNNTHTIRCSTNKYLPVRIRNDRFGIVNNMDTNRFLLCRFSGQW